MPTFLFWNLRHRALQEFIVDLAWHHKVDVLLLAECSIPPSVLLKALNRSGQVVYEYAPGVGCTRIKVFTRFSKGFIKPVYEESRLTIRHLKLPGLVDILVAATHLPSKSHWAGMSQDAESIELAKSIRNTEKEVGHSRTVLVGDLNMNPFEPGMVSANGLHGVMARNVAQRGERIVQGRVYPFFYNPMWGLLGDASPGPPGTYYYPSTEHVAFFWNMFDQIMVRPDLLPYFSNADLKILESDGSVSFLSPRGFPDKTVASDHLPILFALNL